MSEGEARTPHEKATPRPWECVPGRAYIDHRGERAQMPPHVRYHYKDDQGRRCTAFVANCESATLDNDANARLIVEAVNSYDAFSELLEAAKSLQEVYRRADTEPMSEQEWREAEERLDEAIEAVEGSS